MVVPCGLGDRLGVDEDPVKGLGEREPSMQHVQSKLKSGSDNFCWEGHEINTNQNIYYRSY
jgi:hypothetical protein